MHEATESSHSYDFRKEFSAIASPGMRRYLEACGYQESPPNEIDERWHTGQAYIKELWRGLKGIQRDYRERGYSADFELYDIKDWTRESVASFVEQRLEDILDSCNRICPPFGADYFIQSEIGVFGDKRDLLERVGAIEDARKLVDRMRAEGAFDVAIERGVQLLFLKAIRTGEPKPAPPTERQAPIARVEVAEPAAEAEGEETSKTTEDTKTAECMFQRIGFLDAKPRDYLVRGFIARNEVGNPFGKPDSFKGVIAAQLVAHIAGGIDFLGMEVKQAPTAYFAGERGEQAKRRIKGHIQRLGLPYDLTCYFGAKPIDLLTPADLKFLISQVKAIESDAERPLGFLVIDTQSRTMGGDENSTNDGAAYAKAIEALRMATPAALWIIAHSGHDAEKQDRPRGSSALLGAYDTFYRHKKIDERRGEVKVTVDRDGLGGKELAFTVELYDTGAINEDGEPVLVPWISLDGNAAADKSDPKSKTRPYTFKSGPKPTPIERTALDALKTAVKGYGMATPAGEFIPEGVVTVDIEKWRDVFSELYPEDSKNTRWHRFQRASSGLVVKGLVGELGSRRWAIDQGA